MSQWTILQSDIDYFTTEESKTRCYVRHWIRRQWLCGCIAHLRPCWPLGHWRKQCCDWPQWPDDHVDTDALLWHHHGLLAVQTCQQAVPLFLWAGFFRIGLMEHPPSDRDQWQSGTSSVHCRGEHSVLDWPSDPVTLWHQDRLQDRRHLHSGWTMDTCLTRQSR